MKQQIISRNKFNSHSKHPIQLKDSFPDTIEAWREAYFRFEVTTSTASQKVQQRDIKLFIRFMFLAEENTNRIAWSPRLSKAFQDYLKNEIENKKKRYGDRTINRVMAHLKTFSKWIHKLRPFPLGNPMEKIKSQPVGTGLEIERAITPSERRKILDAADLLLKVGGISKDRNRYRGKERPKRKGYRPYRNRAIIYTLIETGMRRQAVPKLNIVDVDLDKSNICVEEKGGFQHTYKISQEGLSAIKDYLSKEWQQDFITWDSPALFLPNTTAIKSQGRLSTRIINYLWNDICKTAGVEGKTPHSARHGMGKHLIDKTGNIAAVQRQLGHRNATYSMQYARITAEELQEAVDDR